MISFVISLLQRCFCFRCNVCNRCSCVSSQASNTAKGPYSQLTRAELISLVLKQDKQLSDRDKKVAELEQYIDNLLVRIMEDSPNILMSLNCPRKAV